MAKTNPRSRLLTFRCGKEGYGHARRNTKTKAQFQSQQKRLVCPSSSREVSSPVWTVLELC